MDKIRLGKTNLMVSNISIGTVPLQRLNFGDSVELLQNCHAAGINFFDTSDNYGDTDAKLGAALANTGAIIATKISQTDYDGAKAGIAKSLKNLGRAAIDLIQLHNPKNIAPPALKAAQEAKEAGLVRHIGFTTHNLEIAIAAANSGLFDTIQYPLNFLSSAAEEGLIALCAARDIGLIAMKPFGGGIIKYPALAFAFFAARPTIVPIYGIQTRAELAALLALSAAPPDPANPDFAAYYAAQRDQMAAEFCRGCELCHMACPAKINISQTGRLASFFDRNPPAKYLADRQFFDMIENTHNCQNCGKCAEACPHKSDMRRAMAHSRRVFAEYWQNRDEYL